MTDTALAPSLPTNGFGALLSGLRFEAAADAGTGAPAGPADAAAGAPDPGPAVQPHDLGIGLPPDAGQQQQAAGLDPQLLADLQEMSGVFRDVRDLAARPAAYEQPQQQPEQPSQLQQALARFDPFKPESIQAVLEAQAADLSARFEQQLEGRLGDVMPVVNDWQYQQGEQEARNELTGFEQHIGRFDHDWAIREAQLALALNPNLDEREALWQAANQVQEREKEIAIRAVRAYEAHRAKVAGAAPNPAGAASQDGPQDVPTGPGKYREQARRTLMARRTPAASV